MSLLSFKIDFDWGLLKCCCEDSVFFAEVPNLVDLIPVDEMFDECRLATETCFLKPNADLIAVIGLKIPVLMSDYYYFSCLSVLRGPSLF